MENWQLKSDKEPYKAYLLKLKDGNPQKSEFKYSEVAQREFSEANAGIPLQFAAVVRTIRTTTILPFALGDKVQFGDCTMTVSGVREEADEAYAQWTNGGYKVKALTVILNGGGK